MRHSVSYPLAESTSGARESINLLDMANELTVQKRSELPRPFRCPKDTE
jgi:hypothetical protein